MLKKGLKDGLHSKTSGRLSKLYILALSAVACLTIMGQFLIQRSISNQLSDSHVINLAGSQRYMSQQIAKYSLLISDNNDRSNYNDKVKKLEYFIRRWEKGHLGLQNGDKDLKLPGDNSEKIKEMFSELDPFFYNILNSAKRIIHVSKSSGLTPESISKNLKTILANEEDFFRRMDDIVHQYDHEAHVKISILKNVELVLFGLTILILIMEGFLIFRPAVQMVKDTIYNLIQSENRALELSEKLAVTNLNLEKPMKDLKDINFAMDKATILVKTDRFGIITHANSKFYDILKFNPDELIGERFNIISSHYHSKAFYDEMWETISEGKVWNKEIQNKTRDGSYVWLDATIVPILDNKNTPESYIGIYSDVTARFRQSINEQKIRSSSILEGQEKERKNIARELHDGLGQMLTALKFNFEGLKGDKSKKEQQKLLELRKQVVETIQETRRISFNLMPNVLSDFGLVPAVKHLVDQISVHSGRKVIFDSKWENRRLDKTVEINLYRIIQEALNNAVKYAEADDIKITMDNIARNLRIQIVDNGKGFDQSARDKRKLLRSGNGIINIQERTHLINGDFRINSAPGEGTKILIKLPLPETI